MPPAVRGYHPRRDSPPPRRRGRRRPDRGVRHAALVRAALPRRTAARDDAGGHGRAGRRSSPRPASPATSGSTAGSTPRTSSRTPTTGRSCSAGPASRPASGRGWTAVRGLARGRPVRDPRGPRRDRHRQRGAGRRASSSCRASPSGVAGDIADRAPAELDPSTPVRRDHRAGLVGRARDRPRRADDSSRRRGGAVADDRGPRPAADPDHPRDRTRRCGSSPAARTGRGSSRRASIAGAALIVAGLAWAGVGAIARRDRDRRPGRSSPVALAASPSPARSAATRAAAARGRASSASPGSRSSSSPSSRSSSIVVTTVYDPPHRRPFRARTGGARTPAGAADRASAPVPRRPRLVALATSPKDFRPIGKNCELGRLGPRT